MLNAPSIKLYVAASCGFSMFHRWRLALLNESGRRSTEFHDDHRASAVYVASWVTVIFLRHFNRFRYARFENFAPLDFLLSLCFFVFLLNKRADNGVFVEIVQFCVLFV